MLRDKIDSLIGEAMMKGESEKKRLETLRLIKSNMLVLEKSGKEYNDASELNMLLGMKKAIMQSITEFTEGNRLDLVDNEKAGLEILGEFLPEEASEDEIIAYVNTVIDSLDHAVSMKDMRDILAKTQAKYPTADGKLVSAVVKDRM